MSENNNSTSEQLANQLSSLTSCTDILFDHVFLRGIQDKFQRRTLIFMKFKTPFCDYNTLRYLCRDMSDIVNAQLEGFLYMWFYSNKFRCFNSELKKSYRLYVLKYYLDKLSLELYNVVAV